MIVIMIFKIGVPSGLQFFFEIAAFSLAVIMMGWLGENQLAAHQIAINVASYLLAKSIAWMLASEECSEPSTATSIFFINIFIWIVDYGKLRKIIIAIIFLWNCMHKDEIKKT